VAHRILIVDDEQATLNLFSSVLKDRYAVETARTAEEALALIATAPPFSVLLADVFLPRMSGIELLARWAKTSPDTVRIALTGDTGRDTVVESVNSGKVFRFVSKPIGLAALSELMEVAVRHYDGQRVERDMMETTVRTCVNLLLGVLATFDPTSFELSQRLRETVRCFARARNLPNSSELELTAALARIGTVSLPALIVNKARHSVPLTPREAELLADVPNLGWQLLKEIPRMGRVAQAIRYQSRNYDGRGAPDDGVVRNDIPLGSRILRIFTDRARLEAERITGEEAQRTMAAKAGVYDPALLAATFEQFPQSILSLVSPTKDGRIIPAKGLLAGMVLVTEIRTNEQLLLVSAGTLLTPLLVQRIQTHVALGSITDSFEVQ